MEHFDNSPTNNQPLRAATFFHGLKFPESKDAIAFTRSGLGEEVLPGFFILNKDLALAVAALRIIPDEEFLTKEARMAQKSQNGEGLRVNEVVEEASALLARLEQKINTSRGIFLSGMQPVVRTNLLTLVLPELPQFQKAAAYINGAVNYVTRNDAVIVTEGAQWNKAELTALLFAQHAAANIRDGVAILDTYDVVRSALEAAPDILNRLQEDGIVPQFTQKTNAFNFWAEAFAGSKCANNQSLHAWLGSRIDWPEELKKIKNDGVLISALITQSNAARNDEHLNARLRGLLPVNALGSAAAQIAEIMSQASLARLARSN